VGCKCTGNTDCDSGLCLDKIAATTALYAAAGMSDFCGQTCCTSEDCPTGTVCFGTAQGGNYCVNAAWLGDRVTTRSGLPGGSACMNDGQCRSGLCASPGLCADTCCSTGSSQCAAGTVCGFAQFPGPTTGFDTHYTANCIPPVAGLQQAGGQLCCADSDCKSNLCLANPSGTPICVDACRNSGDCGGGSVCSYLLPHSSVGSSDTVAGCWPPSTGMGGPGATCTAPAQCKNGLCVGTTCSDPCFVASDCVSPFSKCVVTPLTVEQGGTVEAPICSN
jgi:hypothetical protein